MAIQVLKQTCLRPAYSLRRQLTTAYGVTAFITIVLVVLMATICSLQAGMAVTSQTDELFRQQLVRGLNASSTLTVEIYTKKFLNLKSSSSLVVEVVRDRIVGYPEDGWAEDKYVPFVDRETGQRKYPLKVDLLPRDWQVESNWNLTNLEEHTQERATFFRPYVGFLSTASSMFTFQGNCNPDHTVPSLPGFFPQCSDDHNNASLGGIINPTDTLPPLEQKAADISVFLKPIREAEPSAMSMHVYFANSGAGAGIAFPSFHGDSQASYVSAGCEWMRTTNRYTGRPLGTEEEIARCTPAGQTVPIRLYNALERDFCADQALHPGKTRVFGPYLDSVWSQWRLSVGEAVFDRRTGEFIACVSIDLNLELSTALLDSVHLSNRTDLAITRLDGTVVSGSSADIDFSLRTETFHVVDTEFMSEETFVSLMDGFDFWNGIWDPTEYALDPSALYNVQVSSNGRVYSVTPSPPPPRNVYDPKYAPDFLVFSSYNIDDVEGVLDNIYEKVNDDVHELIMISVSLGCIGLVCLIVFVWVVAQLLTKPLKYMEYASWQIVNHAGQNKLTVSPASSQGPHDEPTFFCMPKTEVKELVDEFQKMIHGFSGSGASRVASPQVVETKNQVAWKTEFGQLYQLGSLESRIQVEMSTETQSVRRRISQRGTSILEAAEGLNNDDPGIEFRSVPVNQAQTGLGQATGEPSSQSTSSSPPPLTPIVSTFTSGESGFFTSTRHHSRLNEGSNLHDNQKSDVEVTYESVRISRSSLFWCILCWIVFPILISIIAISTTVAVRLQATFPTWVKEAKESSYELELDGFRVSGSLRALFSEEVLPGPIRDLHLLTRIASWLLFDAIGRSDSFTDIEMEFVEECKIYEQDEVCPFEADIFRSPCDCLWEDPWNRECQEIPADPRMIQRMWYMNQQRDFDPQTGNRNASQSFPDLDYSKETTSWWTDPNLMPGSSNGANASGFATTYDRLRVISAVATVVFPVYNYITNDDKDNSHTAMSAYVAFESDGAFYGYAGCNYDFARYADFESSDDNKAYLINEALCPKGKFGYDPRCREWYRDARQGALTQNDGVHITMPYRFATVDDIGNSAVSPLIDPATGKFIGSMLIDFSTSPIYDILAFENSNFYAVVSANAPSSVDIVGSSITDPGEVAASTSVLSPLDLPDSKNREQATKIVAKMKEGISGESQYSRVTEAGDEESLVVSWFPITFRELKLGAPNDFTSGATVQNTLLYSLLFGRAESSLYSAFNAIEDEILRQLRLISIVYLCVVAFISLLCILMTARISISVTIPMIELLQVVRRVNTGRIEDDIPPLSGGSREVAQVFSSFAKLYRIVRMSNKHFWSGDLQLAHHIASDALELFRKIGDEKAIAIASNNMGNTLVALMVESVDSGSSKEFDGVFCLKAALRHFDEAIASGLREFEIVESDAEKSDYAQQLGDRHFNRGMALLLSLDHPESPDDARDKGFTDLFRARQYDQGVKEYMLHAATLYKNSGIIFDRIVRRLYGLATLTAIHEDVYQAWDAYELVDEADLMLQAAWRDDNAPLFRAMTKVGRLQQLEGAVVAVELSSGKLNDAALLATRMLVEDEYVIDSAFVEAAGCLLRYSREVDWSHESVTVLRREFRQMKTHKIQALDIGRCYVFCVELGRSHLNVDLGEKLLTLYSSITQMGDLVGIVASEGEEGDGTFALNPDTREKCEEVQRHSIETAVSQSSRNSFGRPALPAAIDMVVNVASSTANDVYLVYVTDGCAWDPLVYAPLIERIRDGSRKRTASIDVIAIGLNVKDDDIATFFEDLTLSTRSRQSMYLAVAEDNESLDVTIKKAATRANAGTSFDGYRIQHGLTMEKF